MRETKTIVRRANGGYVKSWQYSQGYFDVIETTDILEAALVTERNFKTFFQPEGDTLIPITIIIDTGEEQPLRMYCCQPQVVESRVGGNTSHQVPTFYLHPNQLGIISLAAAEIIVRDICNPTKDKNITVHPNVTAVTL